MKRFMQTLGLVLGCLIVLMPSGVSAAGYANIGGQSGYHTYDTRRSITYPPTAGPEVAFLQYSSGSLLLGAHGCASGGGPFYGLRSMTPGVWSAVYNTTTPQVFCLYASANHNWNGDLAWD